MRLWTGLGAWTLWLCACGGGHHQGNGSNATYTSQQGVALCNEAFAHLKSCGVVSDGVNVCATVEYDDAFACEVTCLKNAACPELEQLYCDLAARKTPDDSTALGRCGNACNPQFTCSNGERVDADQKCDGFKDCDDGSDEAGCPAFTCDDGQKVEPRSKCDGFEECNDASDEKGCPTYTCNDGTMLPAGVRCDVSQDCADGEDELGCPARAMALCMGVPISGKDMMVNP